MRRWRKEGTQRQGLGRSRVGFSTKFHLRTNGIGLPVAIDVTPGQASDYSSALPFLEAEGPEPKVLLAVRGYGSDHIHALRNRIERRFNKMKNSRRLATRYAKIAASYLGFVLIAAVRLLTKAFVNRT